MRKEGFKAMKVLNAVHCHPTEASGVIEMTLEFSDSTGADLRRGSGEKMIVRCTLAKNDPVGAVARQLRNMANEIDPPAGG